MVFIRHYGLITGTYTILVQCHTECMHGMQNWRMALTLHSAPHWQRASKMTFGVPNLSMLSLSRGRLIPAVDRLFVSDRRYLSAYRKARVVVGKGRGHWYLSIRNQRRFRHSGEMTSVIGLAARALLSPGVGFDGAHEAGPGKATSSRTQSSAPAARLGAPPIFRCSFRRHPAFTALAPALLLVARESLAVLGRRIPAAGCLFVGLIGSVVRRLSKGGRHRGLSRHSFGSSPDIRLERRLDLLNLDLFVQNHAQG